ncbi:MAG TPA: thioredoxin family protein [Candidatus Eisenbacteria bacterium]
MSTSDALAERYASAPDWPAYLASTVKNHDLWSGIDRHVAIDADQVDLARKAAERGGVRHVVVLSEDWCGDAVNIVPWVGRLVGMLPGVDLRIFGRDANPDLMDAHLTGSSRSIPVIILYDSQFRELGWWGPRPTELQALALGPWCSLPKDERYREIRTWYARDKGSTILAEIIALMSRASSPA